MRGSWRAGRRIAMWRASAGRRDFPRRSARCLWSIFERVRAGLKARKLITHAQLFSSLATAICEEQETPFDFAVVDEAQDISIAHLRFFAALGGRPAQCALLRRRPRPAHLPAALLVESPRRGHSRTFAHLARQLSHIAPNPHAGGPSARPDSDRRGWQQRGPERYGFRVQRPAADDSLAQERKRRDQAVGNWIAERAKAGVLPHEFGVFVRSAAQLDRARAAVKEAGIAFKVLDEHVETTSGHVSISTMHLAKGLEFRAVVVMACDDEIIPLQERIETVGDDADLQEVYDTERHLLYVACTRARDHLLVTSVEPASEFLDDLRAA